MKQYPTGFVPVNFQAVGKVFFVIGALCTIAKGIDFLIETFNLPNTILYFGLTCLALGAYLVFVVPKND